MPFSRAQSGAIMASPNVIPMADIMLVLLIIFMVVTPLIRNGVPVEMAKVDNPTEMARADEDDAVIVAISRDGTTYLGNRKVPLDEISSPVRDRITGRLDKIVFIKCDARAKYGDVVKLVDEVRLAGADNVGLLTDKSDANRRSAPPLPPAD
jgi:biopolymer transport protein ExbD/biopolymer transport protein TolR